MDKLTGGGPCGLCGADPAEGVAHAGDVWLCHTDERSCYHRWTVYGERSDDSPSAETVRSAVSSAMDLILGPVARLDDPLRREALEEEWGFVQGYRP